MEALDEAVAAVVVAGVGKCAVVVGTMVAVVAILVFKEKINFTALNKSKGTKRLTYCP